MATSGFRFRVWCEDRRHEAFVREFLCQRFGLDRKRDIRWFPAPKGLGSASSWVIKQYPKVQGTARRCGHQKSLKFLAVVDRDAEGVAKRLVSLLGPRQPLTPDDNVGIWIPTWNIETWVLWLCQRKVNGIEVDQSASFKHELRTTADFKAAVCQAVACWDPPRANEQQRVPSLKSARHEIERIT